MEDISQLLEEPRSRRDDESMSLHRLLLSSRPHLASPIRKRYRIYEREYLGRAVGFNHPVAPAFSGMTECLPGLCHKGFERVLGDQVSDSN